MREKEKFDYDHLNKSPNNIIDGLIYNSEIRPLINDFLRKMAKFRYQ